MVPRSSAAARSAARCVLAALAAAALAACSTAPPTSPHAGPDPADAAAPARPVTDTGVLGAYTSFRPVAPRPWREQNERVAPQPRP